MKLEYTVRVQFLELYGKEVRDLLNIFSFLCFPILLIFDTVPISFFSSFTYFLFVFFFENGLVFLFNGCSKKRPLRKKWSTDKNLKLLSGGQSFFPGPQLFRRIIMKTYRNLYKVWKNLQKVWKNHWHAAAPCGPLGGFGETYQWQAYQPLSLQPQIEHS